MIDWNEVIEKLEEVIITRPDELILTEEWVSMVDARICFCPFNTAWKEMGNFPVNNGYWEDSKDPCVPKLMAIIEHYDDMMGNRMDLLDSSLSKHPNRVSAGKAMDLLPVFIKAVLMEEDL